jgi:hypothetical protein
VFANLINAPMRREGPSSKESGHKSFECNISRVSHFDAISCEADFGRFFIFNILQVLEGQGVPS